MPEPYADTLATLAAGRTARSRGSARSPSASISSPSRPRRKCSSSSSRRSRRWNSKRLARSSVPPRARSERGGREGQGAGALAAQARARRRVGRVRRDDRAPQRNAPHARPVGVRAHRLEDPGVRRRIAIGAARGVQCAPRGRRRCAGPRTRDRSATSARGRRRRRRAAGRAERESASSRERRYRRGSRGGKTHVPEHAPRSPAPRLGHTVGAHGRTTGLLRSSGPGRKT
jgi:hypothetical protein